MKVTDCCGVPAYSNGDSDTEDIGICPDCKEHCEYIEDGESDDEINAELVAENYQDHPDFLKAEDLIHNQGAKF